MPFPYMSETAKVQDRPEWMKYIKGKIIDIGCGGSKITPEAIGVDGRALPGVDVVCDDLDLDKSVGKYLGSITALESFDTVYSSHYLEHMVDQFETIWRWHYMLRKGGILFLYLPDGNHYNHETNPEHLIDMNYKSFMFWFRRVWCGESHDYKGRPNTADFKLIDHGMDVGEDRYSFFVIAEKL